MKGHFALFIIGAEVGLKTGPIRVLGVVVVWVRVIDLVFSLVENLELHEVEALLDQVHVAEVLEMQYEFCDCPERHLSEINRL